jgi:hypothetical protein
MPALAAYDAPSRSALVPAGKRGYIAAYDDDRITSLAPPPYPLGHGEGSHLIVVVPLDQAPRRSFLIFPAVFQVHAFGRIADKD